MTEREARGQTLVELTMAPGDMGRVIGRQGRTAQAVRTLANLAAEMDGRKVERRISRLAAAACRSRDADAMDDLLVVGRVARAHGNEGQVIVNPETDFPDERFAAGRVLWSSRRDDRRRRRIASVRFQQGRPIVGFEGVETMDDGRSAGRRGVEGAGRGDAAAAGGDVLPSRAGRLRGKDTRRRARSAASRAWKGRWNAAGS